MIIKGGARGKGQELAAHLSRTDTNEKVHILEISGVAAQDLKGAFAEMEAIASGSRATKPLYHVSISPEIGEDLTPEQWRQAADRLGAALGLEDHQRAIVFHRKEGREHCHIVWNRIDIETLKAAHHSHNFRTHEEVARDLEREFGLNRTQGVHAEREGKKPDRERPTTKESQQEARTGWKKQDAQTAILSAWQACKDGATFQRLIESEGYRLARGDRRDFCIIDPAGGIHSLRSGVKKLRAEEARQRFADLDPTSLPSVAEAKAAAIESYRAVQAVKAPPEISPKPIMSVRPPRPESGRYDSLRTPPATNPTPPFTPKHSQPHYIPKPPTWAMEYKPAPSQPENNAKPSVENAQKAEASQPIPRSVEQSSAMRDLAARQEGIWRETLAQVSSDHIAAMRKLEAHHQQRLASLTTDIDKRLGELNGLTSRMGALFDRAAHDREIAYLVAKRQRSLTDEKDRQEKVKDDLRRSQAREIEEAKSKHDRLTLLQQKALSSREVRTGDEVDRPPPRPKPRDFER